MIGQASLSIAVSANRVNTVGDSCGGSLSGGAGDSAVADEPWRAAVESCVVEAGDDGDFDLGALRRQVRAEPPTLSRDAGDMEYILREWEQSRDDKTFAMKTRFFPSGVKLAGVKWTD